MCGVVLIFEPYALIACAAWSSVKTKRIFGRSEAIDGVASQPANSNRAMRELNFMVAATEASRQGKGKRRLTLQEKTSDSIWLDGNDNGKQVKEHSKSYAVI